MHSVPVSPKSIKGTKGMCLGPRGAPICHGKVLKKKEKGDKKEGGKKAGKKKSEREEKRGEKKENKKGRKE